MSNLVIELYAGLHGWGEGFVPEGFRSVGFDIVDMCALLGHPRPEGCQLVIQDVTTLHGSQFRDAAVIVASPPCQAYSYRAMPWKRAKALPPPDNTLFDTCFRIQREANEANKCDEWGFCTECDGTGNFYRHDEDGDYIACDECHGTGRKRYIPLIVENVRGAQKWVGRARWHFGSYYLWGDVPALMPITLKAEKFNPDGTEHGPGSWFAIADSKERGAHTKVPGFRFDGSGRSFHSESVKVAGLNFNDRTSAGFNVAAAQRYREKHVRIEEAGCKLQSPGHYRKPGSGPDWFDGGAAQHGSRSDSRKAASAQIAKIPFPLANHIARCFKDGAR